MSSKSSFNKFGSSMAGGGDRVKELKEVLGGKRDPEAPGQKEVEPEEKSNLSALEEQIKTLEEKFIKSQDETKSAKDKNLRTLAEFDNFRKRMEREKEDMIKYGNEKLLKELLPVLDHLEMTLDHSEESAAQEDPQKIDAIFEGVEMVLKQLLGVLEKFGIEVISGEGNDFDPHRQEAIGVIETSDCEAGKVVLVQRKGYALNNRLIRPALVITAKDPTEEKKEREDSQEEETIH